MSYAKSIYNHLAALAKVEVYRRIGDMARYRVYDIGHNVHALRKGFDEQEKRIRELEEALEVERLRLAACSTAALGCFDGCAEEYRSASLDDTLQLRERADRLEAENARLMKDAQRWWDMVEFTDATSVRDIHALAQDGCRLFYLRPTEGE